MVERKKPKKFKVREGGEEQARGGGSRERGEGAACVPLPGLKRGMGRARLG